jgi:hypothetical protein
LDLVTPVGTGRIWEWRDTDQTDLEATKGQAHLLGGYHCPHFLLWWLLGHCPLCPWVSSVMCTCYTPGCSGLGERILPRPQGPSPSVCSLPFARGLPQTEPPNLRTSSHLPLESGSLPVLQRLNLQGEVFTWMCPGQTGTTLGSVSPPTPPPGAPVSGLP